MPRSVAGGLRLFQTVSPRTTMNKVGTALPSLRVLAVVDRVVGPAPILSSEGA